jgi:hypothetical protein
MFLLQENPKKIMRKQSGKPTIAACAETGKATFTQDGITTVIPTIWRKSPMPGVKGIQVLTLLRPQYIKGGCVGNPDQTTVGPGLVALWHSPEQSVL